MLGGFGFGRSILGSSLVAIARPVPAAFTNSGVVVVVVGDRHSLRQGLLDHPGARSAARPPPAATVSSAASPQYWSLRSDDPAGWRSLPAAPRALWWSPGSEAAEPFSPGLLPVGDAGWCCCPCPVQTARRLRRSRGRRPRSVVNTAWCWGGEPLGYLLPPGLKPAVSSDGEPTLTHGRRGVVAQI